jgi:hypothetical protein
MTHILITLKANAEGVKRALIPSDTVMFAETEEGTYMQFVGDDISDAELIAETIEQIQAQLNNQPQKLEI